MAAIDSENSRNSTEEVPRELGSLERNEIDTKLNLDSSFLNQCQTIKSIQRRQLGPNAVFGRDERTRVANPSAIPFGGISHLEINSRYGRSSWLVILGSSQCPVVLL